MWSVGDSNCRRQKHQAEPRFALILRVFRKFSPSRPFFCGKRRENHEKSGGSCESQTDARRGNTGSACLINVTPVLAQSVHGPQYSYGPPSNYDSTHKPPGNWPERRPHKHSHHGDVAKQCLVDPADVSGFAIITDKEKGLASCGAPVSRGREKRLSVSHGQPQAILSATVT